MPHSGYTINFSNPYKSQEFKDVTEFEILKDDVYIIGKRNVNKEIAEIASYVEVLSGMRVNMYNKPNFDSI